MLLIEKLAYKAAAKALQPALDAANARCAAFAPGDTSDAALAAFCDAVNVMRKQYDAANGYTHSLEHPELVTFKRGSKNAKLIKLNVAGEPSSAYGFVALDTGTILKAAGWNAPAKGGRGNITSGANAVGPHGPHYLR